MNTLLFSSEDCDFTQNVAILHDSRRITHIEKILKIKINDSLRCGILNHQMGMATLVERNEKALHFKLKLSHEPPTPLNLTLVMALARPKSMRKMLQYAIGLGVKQIHIIHASRVDKGYWQSPCIEEAYLYEQAFLALEQVGDTQLPQIIQHRLFKPFVEDILPSLLQEHQHAFVLHPYETEQKICATSEKTLLIIGPEGGFIPFELECFEHQKIQRITLGKRILRCELAVASSVSLFANM